MNTMKPTAMLSQPMAGKTESQIVETRSRAIEALEAMGYTVVNTLFTDEWYSDKSMKERGVVNIPLCFFAKSVEAMSKCTAAYFCRGWEQTRGCRLEHEAAKAYGVKIIYEPGAVVASDEASKFTLEQHKALLAKATAKGNRP